MISSSKLIFFPFIVCFAVAVFAFLSCLSIDRDWLQFRMAHLQHLPLQSQDVYFSDKLDIPDSKLVLLTSYNADLLRNVL